MNDMIHVGLIGANARGGWAKESHVPAVQHLAGLQLAAIATKSQGTADAAAAAFGVDKAYPDGLALIRDPSIDLVVVTTQVPDHRELVLAAIAAGKHVYSEWPLGLSVAQTREMAKAAREAGVHTAIGLQLRASPALHRARVLIASGGIGRPLGISVSSATAGFGATVPPPFLYLEDPKNFANLVTIQGAHSIDLALALGGPLHTAESRLSTRYPHITVSETGEQRRRVTRDHLALTGSFESMATLVVEVSGGRPPETPSWVEVCGENGVLRLEGGAPRGMQSGLLSLVLNGERQQVDSGELDGLPSSAMHVGGVYAALRDDIRHGTSVSVGFDHAVQLTELIDDLLREDEKTVTTRRDNTSCKGTPL